MADKLESATSLTEFSPSSPEPQKKSFSLWNFFRKHQEKDSDSPEGSSKDVKKTIERQPSGGGSDFNIDNVTSSDTVSDTSSNFADRNMSSILQVVRNIADGRKSASYKDSDFKQYWMPDSNCKECYECGDKFTTFRRRHHCRVCGQIFCWRCCNQGIPGKIIGYSGDLRVCTYCFKMVTSYLQSVDSDSETVDDAQSINDCPRQSSKLSFYTVPDKNTISNTSLSTRRKSSVVGFSEEDIARAKPTKSNEYCYDTEYGRSFGVERSSSLLNIKDLKDIYKQLLHPMTGVASLKTKECSENVKFSHTRGAIIVEWLMKNKGISRLDAISVGQALLDANFVESEITKGKKFTDSDVLLRMKKINSSHSESETQSMESLDPLWVKEIQSIDSDVKKDSALEESEEECSSSLQIDLKSESRSRIPSSSSSFYLDLDLKQSLVKVSKPSSQENFHYMSDIESHEECDAIQGRIFNLDVSCPAEGMHNEFAENVLKVFSTASKTSVGSEDVPLPKDEHDSGIAYEQLNSASRSLEINLFKQLLENDGLSPSWCDIVLPIVHRVIDIVHPDVKNDADSMDIREYVQFKKIPGGSKNECTIVSGVVFSKTVAHRKMKQIVQQPTLLLLNSPISYQRMENKFTSLDPVLMQEFEYLKNTIGKLSVFKPDVLLCEKSVSRLAQEMLLSFGITVALNVKPSVMERVARCTQAGIVSTIDAHLSKPQLGTCEEFRVKTYTISGGRTKTLMFLDGCPTNLGCTILLRGGSSNELKKVKQKIKFMLYVAYNWRLERSFLMDEYAFPPCLLSNGLSDTSDTNSEKNSNIAVECFSEPLKMSSKNIGNVKSAESDSHSCSSDSLVEVNIESKNEESNKKLKTKCVDDFSDPLHVYLRSENDISIHSTPPAPNTLGKLLEDIILCCSLNVKMCLPYLETDAGKKNPLRKFFPSEIYWSAHFSKEKETKIINSAQVNFDEENEFLEIQFTNRNVEMLPSHAFISYKITDTSSKELQTLLSNYRARGCTIKYLCPHQYSAKNKEKKNIYIPPNVNINEKEIKEVKDATKSSEVNASSGLYWERKIDALDPGNHQKLAVLFCSYSCASNNAPNYCVNPWVVKMDFYGTNDIPLGGFLERYCFRSSYVCPSTTCDTPMTEHVRKFVHDFGCVHISLQELSNDVCNILKDDESCILMWSWCYKCKQTSPVTAMSEDTWSFSFAKYLELRFYANCYIRQKTQGNCTHSLHHDHYQYFAYKGVVAIFQYNPILVWEIALPPFVISVKNEMIPLDTVVEELKVLAMKGCEIYNTVFEKLAALRQQYVGTSNEVAVTNLLEMQKLEQSEFRSKIGQIQLRVTSPTFENMQTTSSKLSSDGPTKDISSFMQKVQDQMLLIKYYMTESVSLWNERIQDFIENASRKKDEKSQPKSNKDEDTGFDTTDLTTGSTVVEQSVDDELESSCYPKLRRLSNAVSIVSIRAGRKFSFSKKSGSLNEPSIMKEKSAVRLVHSVPHNMTYLNISETVKNKELTEEEKQSDASSESVYMYGPNTGIYAGLKVPEPEDDESYVVCHKAKPPEQITTHSGSHERSRSEGHQCLTDSISKTAQDRVIEDSTKRDKKERTVKTILSQFLSSTDTTLLQNPFPLTQHIILDGTQEKIPIAVYDDEPSSIIAYTLASSEYEQQLQELRLNISSALNATQKDSQSPSPMIKRRQNSKVQSELSNESENLNLPGDDASTDFLDMTLCGSQETDKSGHKNVNRMSNLEIQFGDRNSKFYCRVYYAEQFRKLRCLVFNEGEDRFIRSLSHCIPWEARGGKSGSTFCKTRDDRFILKQMQKLELQSFLNFAPSYFYYINKACLEQKPTLLAKIVGVYRIGFKNTATNTASKMDLLVMENLFYDRIITRKYDLKGSIRNRLVNTNDLPEDDIVLLDENFLRINCDNPLYIRPHAKAVLTLAINNDTQFLSDQEVMDYSLLVGLDDEKMELVIGIIDYIRTFTFGKKVEMIVKSSGILGGHGKMPTIVSPDLYLMRFREAMDGYFLWVPDRWTDKDNNCGIFK